MSGTIPYPYLDRVTVPADMRSMTVPELKGLANDVFEIGYGTTEQSLKASREELNKSFQQMNSRW